MKNLFGILFLLVFLAACQKEELGIEPINPASMQHRGASAEVPEDSDDSDDGITDPDEDDEESEQDTKLDEDITDPDSDDDDRELENVKVKR